MEVFLDIISNILACLLCYYIGKYKAHADIYEKVLDEHARRHFEEEFQGDANKKIKEYEKDNVQR